MIMALFLVVSGHVHEEDMRATGKSVEHGRVASPYLLRPVLAENGPSKSNEQMEVARDQMLKMLFCVSYVVSQSSQRRRVNSREAIVCDLERCVRAFVP